jgi:hypothetical protein
MPKFVVDLSDDLGTGHHAVARSLFGGRGLWSCSCGEGGKVPTPSAAVAAASLHQVGATLVPA